MDLIGPYSNYIRLYQTGVAIIKNIVSFVCMTMIDPAMGWFEIIEVTTYDFNEVMGSNNEYIDKSYARVIQFFNNTCIGIYPRPRKVVFETYLGLN